MFKNKDKIDIYFIDAWVLDVILSWMKLEDLVDFRLWSVSKLWLSVCANVCANKQASNLQISNLWGAAYFHDSLLQSLAHMLSAYTDKRYPLTLDLSECVHITNRGMRPLRRVKNLKDLKLRRCTSITDQGFSNIFNLTALTSVDLSGCVCHSNGFQELGNLTCLRTLILHGNHRISCKVFQHINKLPQLETLDLSRTDVQLCGSHKCACSKAPSALTALTSLNLRGCTLIENKGLAIVVSKLTALRDLNLSWITNLTDVGVSTLTALKNLQTLKLYGCGKVTMNMANVGFPKGLVLDVKWS